MAFATQSWMIFAIMPIFALGGIGAPALQSLATRQVDESLQGQFQGVLASAVSLASIVCPLAFSTIYFVVRAQWPGAIWLSALVVYAIMVPLVLGLRFANASPQSSLIPASRISLP
jgi:DHA1 family tetracycline resistance protein-like MFS transporter